MQIIGEILYSVLWIFLVLLFVRLVVDWVQFFARSWEPRGVLLVILEGVYTVTDPPLKALRKVIPPLRLGGFALDLSFLLLIVIIYVLQALVLAIFGR
ncbi:YggT family protein [Actinopolymorpha cephalotaxi]|uniref:YggT family protein n=2 Tax=Actinopolymorpha TaxID=117156 RepID=A0A1H1X689_9ACTN|nr:MULTISPECIES: YggT family protein [Actinopolymorpha]NYH82692.1 YggT family protein [Actinopolymorpha cephalotaxi]SDT04099.1 YggT family protein [Actinopolymorpha singaporensis]SFG97802.1 YggT family protein [Actinopolymorpha cephalotaxi]